MKEQEAKGENGMMTVEAVICLTIFVAFFVIMLNMVNLIYLKQKMQAALKPIAIQISRDYYIDQSIQDGGTATDRSQVSQLMKCRRELSMDVPAAEKSSDNVMEYIKNQLYLSMADYTAGYSKRNYLSMWIVGGYDGLSFAGTGIDKGDSGNVEIVVSYRVRIVGMPFFDKTGINVKMQQRVCTKLWN